MKKTVLSEYFVYEFPVAQYIENIRVVEPILETKKSTNNDDCIDIYIKRKFNRCYYGKKRRYYSDYI